VVGTQARRPQGTALKRGGSGKRTPRVRAKPPALAKVLAALRRHGLLLTQDPVLPSLVTLVTGERLRGSWWSHPEGRKIFLLLGELAEHPDVVRTKLLAGKDTWIHRRLWPDLLAAATAGERWQRRALTPAARALLRRVDRASGGVAATGAAARLLEERLLVHASEHHTAAGRHELRLETWARWAARTGAKAATGTGRAALEVAAQKIDAPLLALPWTRFT
jgi:hypothetical protein